MDSPNVGEVMWSRIKHLIPDAETANSNVRRNLTTTEDKLHGGGECGLWSLKGLNHRMRFLRYDPGDFFEMHSDGSYVAGQDESFLTLMLYLNSGVEGGDFEGGGTTFISQEGTKTDDSNVTYR